MEPPRDTERMITPLARLSARLFGAVAAWRNGRAVHTCGIGITATVHPCGVDQSWFGSGATPAIVRWSRGAGLPEPLPDILGVGLAIERSPGDRLDILLASSSWKVLLRHLLIPGRRFDRARFTSLAPFEVDSSRLVQGARLIGPGPPVTMSSMPGSLHGRQLELCVATPSGTWTTVAFVELHGPADQGEVEDLALSPWSSTSPFAPTGLLNRLRDAAYLASEHARRTRPQALAQRR